MDMKPADYRHRLPQDKDAEYIEKTIRRLNLFTDPTLHQPMYPVDDAVHRQIYDGISRDGGGRVAYLTVSISFIIRYRVIYPRAGTVFSSGTLWVCLSASFALSENEACGRVWLYRSRHFQCLRKLCSLP